MISDLRGLETFKSLLDKDEHFFAPNLCNFLCAIKKNKDLWHATNEKALAEENEDSSSLNAKEAQLLRTLENEHKKVEQYYEEHSIKMPIGFMGVEGINEFRAYKQGKIVSTWHIIDSLIHAHINALSNLVNTDLDFVKQFAFVNDKNAITALKIYPLIDEWNAEKQKLTRNETGKFWYAWKQLTQFHDTYHDFEHLRIKALKNGDLLEEWRLCEDVKKINNLNNSKDILCRKELRFYVQQLVYALESLPQKAVKIPTASSLKQSPLDQKKYITARINRDRIELFMCKKEELTDQQEADMAFKMRTGKGSNRRYELLALLVSNAMGVSLTTLHEKLGLENSKQLDKAIGGINDIFRLKTKWKTDDLIVRKKSKIIINNDYVAELIL